MKHGVSPHSASDPRNFPANFFLGQRRQSEDMFMSLKLEETSKISCINGHNFKINAGYPVFEIPMTHVEMNAQNRRVKNVQKSEMISNHFFGDLRQIIVFYKTL